MDYNVFIKILILISFLTIFAIEDIINQKVSNFLILYACFINLFLNLHFSESIWGSSLLYFPLFLIALFYWNKGYIGGGDLKSIIVVLYFINYELSISFCLLIDNKIPDILEFFIFFFLLLSIKKPNPISILFERPFIYKFKSEKYPILPYFLISYLFTLFF
jgi:Flp pilus assembly protein protease CpaA